jgi:hypothetical protein
LGLRFPGCLKGKDEAMAINQVDQMVAAEGPATAAGQEQSRTRRTRRPLGMFLRGLFAMALLVPALALSVSPVAADHSIATSTTCNNYVGNGGGQGVICEVTIVNTITATGGSAGSATVTIHECIGAANAALDGVCSTTTTVLSAPVTSVTQCDHTVQGGGATLLCSINITNNFVNIAPGPTAVTVDQCVGSGDGQTIGCNPVQSTTDAVVTQCDNSAYGGTLVEMTCTATGTMSSAFAMTIDQCNYSAYGGGSSMICSTSLVNQAAPAATANPSTRANSSTTPPPSSTVNNSSGSNSAPLFPLMILLAFGGLAMAIFVTQRRAVRN